MAFRSFRRGFRKSFRSRRGRSGKSRNRRFSSYRVARGGIRL